MRPQREGTVAEVEDFLPYGGIRFDSKSSYGGVRNKYAGTIYDSLSQLNYAQARYQNSNRGQFISEDPIFLGNPADQNLANPQSLNSYSYVFVPEASKVGDSIFDHCLML